MDESKNPKKQFNKYLRFSAIAIQMGVTIGGLAYLGVWLDGAYNAGGNMYTLICTLFGVGASMYLVIKEVIKISKENDE